MRMSGMYKEDQDTKKGLESLQNIAKLEEEADVVLEGGTEELVGDYNIIKPEDGVDGINHVKDPFKFAQDIADKSVLIKHGDGSFEFYNHKN